MLPVKKTEHTFNKLSIRRIQVSTPVQPKELPQTSVQRLPRKQGLQILVP